MIKCEDAPKGCPHLVRAVSYISSHAQHVTLSSYMPSRCDDVLQRNNCAFWVDATID